MRVTAIISCDRGWELIFNWSNIFDEVSRSARQSNRGKFIMRNVYRWVIPIARIASCEHQYFISRCHACTVSLSFLLLLETTQFRFLLLRKQRETSFYLLRKAIILAFLIDKGYFLDNYLGIYSNCKPEGTSSSRDWEVSFFRLQEY